MNIEGVNVQRYFIKQKNIHEEHAHIDGEDVHHISRVMRYEIGDKIICILPNEQVYQCIIEEITDSQITVGFHQQFAEERELSLRVTIAQALPKGNKLDFVLQKGTELGAHSFLLFHGERSVVKLNERKVTNRLNRFERIVKEASEQSERTNIPTVSFTQSITTLIEEQVPLSKTFFAYEEEAKKESFTSLATVLSSVQTDEKIMIIIGPEGGFSPKEVTFLQGHGCIPIRLGRRILRTETAALYALSSISYHFEELRCHCRCQP